MLYKCGQSNYKKAQDDNTRELYSMMVGTETITRAIKVGSGLAAALVVITEHPSSTLPSMQLVEFI